MPKQGAQRKAKRGARQAVEKAMPELWRPTSEVEARHNQSLVAQSLRWNTGRSPERPTSKADLAAMGAKEIALLVTRRNMLSPDPKISNAAVSNLIRMEQQNQADERPSDAQQHLHVHGTLADNPYANAPTEAIHRAMAAFVDLQEQTRALETETG